MRLPRLIGLSRALDLILTGRPVGSEEALVMGLANRWVETGQARAEAEKLLRKLQPSPGTAPLATAVPRTSSRTYLLKKPWPMSSDWGWKQLRVGKR